MRLYIGSSQHFIADTVHNQITHKLKDSFFNAYGHNPSKGEENAWRNSLSSLCQIFQYIDLKDRGIILEYQLPMSSRRLDCLISGCNNINEDNAVIVELKQWEHSSPAEGNNEVITWVGGAEREVLHPSVQAGQYCNYLKDTHTAFNSGKSPISLTACSYLHNYLLDDGDCLTSDKFTPVLENYPLFCADDVNPLCDFIQTNCGSGDGLEVLRRIEDGKYRPSKKLMDHVAGIIKGKHEFVLLDEQLVSFDKVLAVAKKGFHDKRKTIILIRGGPGTGKSVVAINLMSELLLKGYNAHYATGSRAFTQTLRKVIGTRGSVQFKYFNNYMNAPRDAIDVIICDEAHRIRKVSHNRFTPRAKRTNQPQINEIINAGKVCVFFLDDAQVVRPDEIGSSNYIINAANENKCHVHEYKLDIQFRCNGSDAFVKWIENTLAIRRTANALWVADDDFDFRIIDNPHELEDEIKERALEGYSARMTAGFCWKWSKKLNSDKTLKLDVVIDNYRRPWNARPEATRLAKGIPKATLWANDPNGIDQIGCVYTAQGFEFDYVGVIFGEDLVYNFDEQKWIGSKEHSGDPVVKRSINFVDLVKNTYRVLLSRGLKGCYIHFIDKNTEKYFKSRIDMSVKSVTLE